MPDQQPITDATRRRLFALMSRLNIEGEDRREWLSIATAGKTNSVKALTEDQAEEILLTYSRSDPEANRKSIARRKMARKIIALLAGELYWVKSDKPDYDRINQLMRHKSPSKKHLWGLSYDEMHQMVNMVEQMVKNERAK